MREIVIPFPAEFPVTATTVITDVSALAATYKSVAAALTAAGLTAEQFQAYRVAMISAFAATRVPDSVERTPVLAKNMAFLKEHPDEQQSLADAAVENSSRGCYPDPHFPAGWCVNKRRPDEVERHGVEGIWYTP